MIANVENQKKKNREEKEDKIFVIPSLVLSVSWCVLPDGNHVHVFIKRNQTRGDGAQLELVPPGPWGQHGPSRAVYLEQVTTSLHICFLT